MANITATLIDLLSSAQSNPHILSAAKLAQFSAGAAQTWIKERAADIGGLLAKAGFRVEDVYQIDAKDVPAQVFEWMKENPGQTAFYMVNGVLFFAPGLLSVPMLTALGFGANGVRAGSIAARLHAMLGPVAPRSIFSLLQGAGAGGAAQFVVQGIVRGAAALGGGVGGVLNWMGWNGTAKAEL